MFNYLNIARIAAIGAVFAAGWVLNGWRLNSHVDQLKAQHSQAVAAAAQEAAIAEENFRREERRLQEKVDNANKELQAFKTRNGAIRAEFERNLDGLQSAIAHFAASAGHSEESLSACRRDAAILGDVLGETLQREERLTAEAENLAATARALLESWPK